MMMFRLSASSHNDESAPLDDSDLTLIQDGRLYLGDRNQISTDGYPTDMDRATVWTR